MIRYFYLLVALALAINFSYADKRSYVWTYEYVTLERGEKELEHYMTLSSPDFDQMTGKTTTVHQLEYEMGMTSHFDIGLYQSFKQGPTGGMAYDEFKIRGRYRIGEKNKYFVDPLLYLEYIGKPDFSKSAIEFKLILAKDLGNFNISANPYIKWEKGTDGYEFVPNYALGMNYELTDLLRIGVEFKGNKDGHYIGPVIAHGNESAYWVIGSALKIGEVTAGKPEINIRTILGVRL